MDLVRFSWGVPQNGVKWVDASRQEGRSYPRALLKRFLSLGVTGRWRRYSPMEEFPALFRTFAEIDLTEESVLSFARQYGALGDYQEIWLPEGPSGEDPDGVERTNMSVRSIGEELETWVFEIVSMRHCLSVWEALRKEQASRLQEWFHLDDYPNVGLSVSYTPDEPLESAHSPYFAHFVLPENFRFIDQRQTEVLDKSRQPTPAEQAHAFLRAQINPRLEEHTKPELQYSAMENHPLPLGLHIVPQDLLGALWIQLALAIQGNTKYERCGQCNSWFEVSPKAKRLKTIYCSTRCRVAAYRARKDLSRRLSEDGVDVKEIAQRLNTDTKTVRGWLRRNQEKLPQRRRRRTT